MFKRHPKVGRLAICDIDAGRLSSCAKEFQIKETYARLEDILKSGLDAVAIFTQPWLHAPQAIAAMEAGKHVYSAVPIICLSEGDEMLDWCDRIVKTSRATGLNYMMGETSHYRPEAMYCRRRAKDFGTFVHAEGRYLHDIDLPDCNLRDVARNRAGKDWNMKQSGDPPMHYPTHSLGGFLSVMNAHVTELSAFGVRIPGDDWYRPDTVSGNLFGDEIALMRLSNGATAEIKEYRKIGALGYEGFSIYGTEASLEDSFETPRWVTRESIGSPLTAAEMRDPLPADYAAALKDGDGNTEYGGHGGSHAYLVNEFVDSVVNRRTPAVNAWTAARYFAPGVVAHKSALKDGAIMKVPDWGNPPA